jgi:(1->4)-alpha-D-glucan 1-alpha-D-glucosylmutase
MERSIFDFVRDVLLPVRPGAAPPTGAPPPRYPASDEEGYERRLDFSMKLQQYTAPVQAKGIEDTAFYRHTLLLSLNEVGGDPDRFGRTPADFHQMNVHRLARWPFGLNATATHDTKLGEDVRTRIDALSEMPEDWRKAVWRWRRLNAKHRRIVDGEPAPDRTDEYRFYQVLVGSWPAFSSAEPVASLPDQYLARVREYMTKATKEAKEHTSWINDNREYDEAVTAFVTGVLTGPGAHRFLAEFAPFQQRVASLGMIGSLSQLVLKIMSPGVPDIYRGTELWDLALVDPDNRRPVDFTLRAEALALLEGLLPGPGRLADVDERTARVAALIDAWPDGRIKLFLTAACLRFRRDRPGLLLDGQYVPLAEELSVPAGLISFARLHQGEAALVVAPRLVARIASSSHPVPLGGEAWRTSRVMLPADLGDRTYRNLFTGEEVRPVRHGDAAWIFVGEALRSCPVAVLVSDASH